jgi:hypothetical protein
MSKPTTPPMPVLPTRYAVLPNGLEWPKEITTNGNRINPRNINGVTFPDSTDLFVGGYEAHGRGWEVLAIRSRTSDEDKLRQAVAAAPALAASYGLPAPTICATREEMLAAK